jgi:hypothetical protein
VLADPIAGHTGGFARYWSGEDAWLLAIGLLVLGGALLAVRTVAGRVAALHRELDGVI